MSGNHFTRRGAVPLLVASLLVFGCSGFVSAEGSLGEIESPSRYRVQPGDILDVYVWGEPELQRSVLVRPDNSFSFPLVGDVNANDKSPEGIGLELSQKLTQFVPGVSVSVAVNQVNGNKIYVIGKVNRPGEYTVGRPVDVMQALSMAGGTTPFASLNDIKILRRSNVGVQDAIPFNYSQVERGKKLEQNRLLVSGDVIVVP